MKRTVKNWVTITSVVVMVFILSANSEWREIDKVNTKTIQAQQLRIEELELVEKNLEDWSYELTLEIEQLEIQLEEHKTVIIDTQTPVVEYKTITKTNTVEKENALETATKALLEQAYKRMSQDMYNHVIEYHENGNLAYGNEVEWDEELFELLELYGYSMDVNDLVDNAK